MALQQYESRAVHLAHVPARISVRSLLLVLSGTVRKYEKESMMAKFKKRMVKWGLAAAKVGLAVSIIVGVPVVSVQASEFEGFDGLEQSSFIWFGVGKPLKNSAPPTTGAYRTPTQPASAQVLLADGLKAEYVTRTVGNNADSMININYHFHFR